MSLDKGTVKRVAQLARLRLDDEQLEKTAEELNKIFTWIEQLDEVDVSNTEPWPVLPAILYQREWTR